MMNERQASLRKVGTLIARLTTEHDQAQAMFTEHYEAVHRVATHGPSNEAERALQSLMAIQASRAVRLEKCKALEAELLEMTA